MDLNDSVTLRTRQALISRQGCSQLLLKWAGASAVFWASPVCLGEEQESLLIVHPRPTLTGRGLS